MPHYAQGTTGWTKLSGYQALWDPKIDLGKFYFTTFQGEREETPYMTADNFARVIDILRNEDPVYGNATTGSVTTQLEEVGEEEELIAGAAPAITWNRKPVNALTRVLPLLQEVRPGYEFAESRSGYPFAESRSASVTESARISIVRRV